MASTDIEIQIKAIDRATAALNRIEKNLRPMAKKVGNVDKQFKKVDKSISKASGSFGKFKGMLAGAITVGGLGAFGKSVLDATGKAEDLKVALTTVTGSAANADKAFDFIREFTETTPFQVENVAESFIKLQNAGLKPNAELMRTLGNAASVSSDKVGALQAITDLYSRTVAGGLGVEELDRLNDRGIPVYDILSKKLKIARQDVSEFGKTAAGATEITNALTEGFNERFEGGMERASQTLNGKLSTLKDTIDGVLIKIGEGGLSDAVKNIVTQFTTFAKENEHLALALGEKLGNALTFIVENAGVVKDLFVKLQPVFELIGNIITEVLWPALKIVVDILATVAEALLPIVEKTGPAAVSIFQGLANVATEYVIPAFETLIGIIITVVDTIKDMIHWVSEGLTSVKNMASGVKDTVTGGLGAAGEKVGEFASGAKNKFFDLYDYVVGNSVIPDLVEGVDNWMGDKLMKVVGSVTAFADKAKGKFWDLYDYVVGNSVIPDMVTETGQHMEQLPKKMVNPVTEGVNGAKKAFEPLTTNASIGAANNVSSALNFNISGVNASQPGNYQEQDMRKYIEGVAVQVAHDVLRQNSKFGGLAR